MMKLQPYLKLQLTGASLLALSASPLIAEGPSDLEALAKEAREAAAQEIAPKPIPEKKVAEKKEAPVDPAQSVAEPVPPVEQPKASELAEKEKRELAPKVVDLEKRSQALGLISQVSPRATGVFSFSNGVRVWEELNQSLLGKLAMEQLEENDVDLTSPEGPGNQLGTVFGEQVVFVVGEGTPAQTKNLMKLRDWSDKYQIATLAMLVGGPSFKDILGNDNNLDSLKLGLENDPDFLVNLLSAAEMPPILVAAKISDDKKRAQFASTLQEGFGFLLMAGAGEAPFIAEEKFEAGGVSFAGVALDGEGLIDSYGEMMNLKQGFETYLDPAAAQDAVNTLKKKDLVLASGVSEDAIYLYLGSRSADIPLVKDGEASLASGDQFAFVDEYLDETLLTVNWVSDALVNSVYEDQVRLGSSIDGLLFGLEAEPKLGEIGKLKSLLEKVRKLEISLMEGYQYQPTGSLSYLTNEGLRCEAFGGTVDPTFDWKTPFAMGSDAGNAFLTVQAIENREVADKQVAYFEAIGEAGYEMAIIAQRNPALIEQMSDYVDGFALFDKKMKTDSIELWNALRKSGSGFGVESVLEIDLGGTWPTVPKVPEIIIEKGAAPRISLVRSVTDADALQGSWKEVEGAVGRLLKTASEEAGQRIPMQKPMSSTSDGLKTWFYPIPMQTDDFVPSLTIGNEIAVFSTSKNRALELGKSVQGAPQEGTGVKVDIQFGPLQKFLQNWLELVGEEPKAIIQDEDARESFLENQEEIESAIKGLEDLDSYSSHTRLEDGLMRSSVFLKTK